MTENGEEETLNPLKRIFKIPMETGRRRNRSVLEETLLEILARLPLRSIARFKSVCKTWKSVIESAYFRRLFVSLHQKSSSSWSLMFITPSFRPITEAMGFHGCKTWDLPKSLVSYILPLQMYPNLSALDKFYLASSSGLIWIEVAIGCTDNKGYSYKHLVGNPVLQQWVEIPHPPEPCFTTGLVTCVDGDGLVSSFKVVNTCHSCRDIDMYEWRVYVYSSETGTWTFKRLLSSHPVDYVVPECSSMNLNGILYMWASGSDPTRPGVLIAHDFYGPEGDDQCQVITLPLPYNECVRRCLTTSRGDVIYIVILDRMLKVWKLNDNGNSRSSECWKLLHEINIVTIGFDVSYFPMGMNPFDTDIVYLWSRQHYYLVSGNLKTQEFIVHQESEKWSSSEGCYRLNTHDSKWYMKGKRDVSRVLLMVSQFVLPQWIDSVPRPPN